MPPSRQKSMIDLREPYLDQQHRLLSPHQQFHQLHRGGALGPRGGGGGPAGPLIRSRTEHDLKRSRSRGSGLDSIHLEQEQMSTLLRRQMVRHTRWLANSDHRGMAAKICKKRECAWEFPPILFLPSPSFLPENSCSTLAI